MRRMPPTRAIAAMVLAGAVMGAGLTGCAFASPEPDTTTEESPVAEFGNVPEAVTAAVPRIVAVEDLGQSRNGFGQRFDATLLVDSAEPLSADELDAAVEAIWRTLPWEPNAVALVAGVESADGVDAVDLRQAAGALSPMGATDVGQGGVSLFDMDARYGAWTAPE